MLSSMENAMLQIRLLGQFDIRLNGKRVLISSRVAQSLLAYLALTAGTSHRREKLAGIFWPDVTEEKSRTYLRHELWRIRKAISTQQSNTDNYLLAEELTITFNRNSDFWLDVAQIERPDTDLQSLTSNLSLYQGELLPGFYEDWIALERERIQSIFDIKMEQLVAQLVDTKRWMAVQEQAERWLALGNTLEPAYRALMLTYGVRGDMAKVSSVYQRCITELNEQFGLEPSAETRALYDGLLKGAHIPPQQTAHPSGTITFLFTDIEESTHLLEKLGNQYAAVLAEHHRILRAALQKWNGHEVDTQGDAFFVTFSRALDAVQCSAEAQRALASHSWVHSQPLRVRMGLHTGEPLIAPTGYVGMDVHRAARIGDAGHGGQILLSQTTRDLVLHDLPEGLGIRDLGEHRLKDLKFPTPIYQLIVEGLARDFPPLRTKFAGTEAPTPGEPPFKGLEYFDETDSDLFFGREQLTAKLVNRLRETQFLSVIIGASGSGKSSLVRAGVIPAIKTGEALIGGIKPPEGSMDWQVHVITPTAHPLEALAIELTHESESITAAATLTDDLMQEPRSLALFLERRNPRQHTLLVLDQFEELFTLCRDEFEREAFIDNLLTTISTPLLIEGASGSQGKVTLIITLRADFYAHLAQYPQLRDAVAKQQEYIGPMTTEELRRAIEEPAKRGHWEFEPGLVDLILRDVGDEPGALPLLSHALLETWKRRAGHTLTLKGYADAGGVQGAIAHTAESVYQNLSTVEQAIARNVFLRLTELGEGTEDTRRRTSFDELILQAEDADEVRAVLNLLADARLITLGEKTAEVAHEALIREWPTLREWLNQDRESLQLHRHLTECAQEWELLERDPGSLYRGARLVQAREWAVLHPTALNAGERAFLEASKQLEQNEQAEREAQQERELEVAHKLAETESRRAQEQVKAARGLRRLAAGLVIFLITAVGAAWFAFNQRNSAQDNFVTAERIRLASQAQIALDNGEGGDLPALLAMRSLNLGYSPEADTALLNALTRGFTRQIYIGHSDAIYDLDFSPDGRYLATASLDATARLWDIQSGQEIRRFAPPVRIVYAVEFSPDGRYLLTGNIGTDGARLWDVQTGQQVRQFIGHNGGPYEVKFSPDGQFVVTSDDRVARLWDVQTGQQLREFAGHTDLVSPVTFSPDGHYIATASRDDTARIWDVATGQELRRFSSDTDIVFVAFSPNGQYLLTMSGTIAQLWEIQTGQEIRRFAGHTNWVVWGEFSPDGQYLLTGSNDKTARLWQIATGQELRQFIGHTGGVWTVGFSPDGRFVATGSDDRTARLWEVSPETEPRRISTLGSGNILNASTLPAALSPDGHYLVHGFDKDGKAAAVWNTQTGSQRYLRFESKVILYTVSAYAFSFDNRYLLGGGDDGVVWLWDAQTGETLHQFTGHKGPVRTVIFSSDGRLLLTGSEDETARLWDAQTGLELQQFTGHSDPIRAVAFSPDGQFILTGSDDQTARLWDTHTGTELQQYRGHTGPIRAVAFSRDGKFILTGSDDQTARLWDVQSGQEIRQFIGHTGQVSRVAFSPDGSTVLTGSVDQTARLWETETGQILRQFAGHISPVLYLGFLGNGHSVITGDTQATYIWRKTLKEVTAFTCTQLTRDLTVQEQALYHIADDTPTCPK
jgi:WD40 repeat protein/class 3 adenylate cyclase